MSETHLPENAEILLYGTEDGTVKVDVLYRDESFWLTQKRMAELFGVQRPAITKHLKNIIETKELEEDTVCSILEHTAADGKTYRTQYCDIDAFLRFNDYEILDNPGQVSARVAKELAEKEYAAFRVEQDKAFESDFDRLVEKSGEMGKKGKES